MSGHRDAKADALLAGFYPRSLVVVGASSHPGKRGYQAVRALQQGGFKGRIYPVNPGLQELLGLTCYPDLESLPGTAELALICTPATSVPQVLRACGSQGVKVAVVLAAGFSESGPEGQALQAEAVKVAAEEEIRIIGPNTSGIFNMHAAMNLVGYRDLQPGPVGILSQSGNMALSLVTEGARDLHAGFSSYIGVGNAADLALHEYLDYFAADLPTRVVAAYIEGVGDGRAFLQAAAAFTAQKPLLVYKSGRSASGQAAARSHTGALAGSYQVARGVMQQAGVLLVDQPEQLLPLSEALATQPLPRGKRVAVLADGGGHATLAADELDAQGLQLAELQPQTRQQLAALLPASAGLNNPIDVAGATDDHPAVFARCSEILLADPGVDQLLVVGLFGGYALRFDPELEAEEIQASRDLVAQAQKAEKPLLIQSLYARHKPAPLQAVAELGYPVMTEIDIAVAAIKALTQYADYRRKIASDDYLTGRGQASQRAHLVMKRATLQGRSALLEPEAKQLLRAFEIPLPAEQWITRKEDLAHLDSKWLQQPLAMKLVSADVLHKSDAGGVQLNLYGLEELDHAWQTMEAEVRTRVPEARLQGRLLTPMAADKGTEIILGVTCDPQYGHLLMFGLGGIFVEVFQDVAFRALPLSRSDAWELLAGLRSSAILNGVRGQAAIDKEALVELMLKLSALVTAHPEISELDLNPVRCYREGYQVLDARIILNQEGVETRASSLETCYQLEATS
ncbi:acetate--CoA ligase family protein [Marinospirillum perlucidum]|uniref:acetate--CoA ligase family protein n=1 Tax=Marinospirillum perlucidum TaxID=1982602 RepID=UPI000DF171FD|nr:acetate--CoA ligase [Marinospirillum perlucidum]